MIVPNHGGCQVDGCISGRVADLDAFMLTS